MHRFKSYHPVVCFLYFFAVIGFSMFFMHPVCTGLSLVLACANISFLKGLKGVMKNILGVLLIIVFGAVFNGLFNHNGNTIISYLPGGKALTLEAVGYGAIASGMIGTVIVWFSVFNEVLTRDKLIYLFGRILPSFALVLSMTMRLIERFKRVLGEIYGAQKSICKTTEKPSKSKELRTAMTAFSAGISSMLEGTIETANSMYARGFGLKGRSNFSIFRFTKRDGFLLAAIILLAVFVLVGGFKNAFYFEGFPDLCIQKITVNTIWFYAAYFLVLAIPVLIEGWGEIKWKFLK